MSCRRNHLFLDLPGPGLAYLAVSVGLYVLAGWLPSLFRHPLQLLTGFFTLFWLVGTVVNNFDQRAYPNDPRIFAGRVLVSFCIVTATVILWQQFPRLLLEALVWILPCWCVSWITGGYTGTHARLMHRRWAMLAREQAGRQAEEAAARAAQNGATEADTASAAADTP